MAVQFRNITATLRVDPNTTQEFSFFQERRDFSSCDLLEKINKHRTYFKEDPKNDARLVHLALFLQECDQRIQEISSCELFKYTKEEQEDWIFDALIKRVRFPFKEQDWALILDLFEKAKEWNLSCKEKITPKRFKITEADSQSSLFSFTFFPKDDSFILHLKNKKNRTVLGKGYSCKVTVALQFTKQNKVGLVAEKVGLNAESFFMHPRLTDSAIYLQNECYYTYFGRRIVKKQEGKTKEIMQKHVCFLKLYDGTVKNLLDFMKKTNKCNLQTLLQLSFFCIQAIKNFHLNNLTYNDLNRRNVFFRFKDGYDLEKLEFILADFEYVEEATDLDKRDEIECLKELFKKINKTVSKICGENSVSKKIFNAITQAVVNSKETIEAVEKAFNDTLETNQQAL